MTACRDSGAESDIGESQLEEEISARESSEYMQSEEELEDNGETDEESEGSEETDEGGDSEDGGESDIEPDLARGIGNIETSSEDDDDLDDLFPKEPEIEHSWGELDKDAPRGDEVKLLLITQRCTVTSLLYTFDYVTVFFRTVFGHFLLQNASDSEVGHECETKCSLMSPSVSKQRVICR